MEEFESPASSLTLYQRALLTLLTLLAAACSTLAVTAWRAVDALAAGDAVRQNELRSFHAGLVSELKGLAEQTGILTSADLCPVRFRVRLPGKRNPPARPVHGTIVALDDETRTRQAHSSDSGVLEFGLLSPGGYRLDVATDDGYRLRHEFEVLPGVPVDRLVQCPHRNECHPPSALRIAWPAPLRERGLVAVCEVAPDEVAVGEWAWTPAEGADVLIVAAPEGRDADELKELLQQSAGIDAEIRSGIPFRYSRLTGLTVFDLNVGGEDGPRELGRFLFAGEGSESGKGEVLSQNVVMLNCSAPRCEHNPTAHGAAWIVEIPDEVGRALQRAIASGLGAPQTGTETPAIAAGAGALHEDADDSKRSRDEQPMRTDARGKELGHARPTTGQAAVHTREGGAARWQ